MKVLKFGGRSLETIEAIKNVKSIIEREAKEGAIAVVLSARGNVTDLLLSFLEKAKNKDLSYQEELSQLGRYHKELVGSDIAEELLGISQILEGVFLLRGYTPEARNKLLSYGEVLSCKTISSYLNTHDINTTFVDARSFIFSHDPYNFDLNEEKSYAAIAETLKNINTIPIITGFIASTPENETITLGRNGSDYSASIIAHAIDATELQIWTHVDGIFTADPTTVEDAKVIDRLSYSEANELANFGTQVLHAKSILPAVEKNIPIHIRNTYNPTHEGTIVSKEPSDKGVRALSVHEDAALISIEGRGLRGKIGIDGRIFNALQQADISVRMISQASSERSIGFVVEIEDGERAVQILSKEFENELQNSDISSIHLNSEISILSIIGQYFDAFYDVFDALRKNKVQPYLVANAINGQHISIAIDKHDLKKSAEIIHSHIFGNSKTLNIAIYGIGAVGNVLIDQILENQERINQTQNLRLNVFALANSKQLLLATDQHSLRSSFDHLSVPNHLETLFNYAKDQQLENLIFVDVTASEELTTHYPTIISNGFNLVAANKKGNVKPIEDYKQLRQLLQDEHKTFLYETNVGASLPLIDTIRYIYRSGDTIKKIRGVFSGSLSFIFNHFSKKDLPFSEVLRQAVDNNFTEPDPREDLNGFDVARKLLILAREIGFESELTDVDVESLIPTHISPELSLEAFYEKLDILDAHFSDKKHAQKEGHVLRYIGELDQSGTLSVKLISVPESSSLGGLTGSDSIFEIFTERYQDNPLVIQGAGAGTQVTASGVLSDILKIGHLILHK